jgi:hypothetical protein
LIDLPHTDNTHASKILPRSVCAAWSGHCGVLRVGLPIQMLLVVVEKTSDAVCVVCVWCVCSVVVCSVCVMCVECSVQCCMVCVVLN